MTGKKNPLDDIPKQQNKMKRKHGSDTSDTPAPAIATTPTTSTTPHITTAATPTTTTSATTTTMDTEATFESLGLDARLLQGVAKLGFAHPTLVQAKAIPLALEGKDILGMPLASPVLHTLT